MIKAIFFDFDGVIVDSTDIKTDAFYELFLEFGEEKALRVKQYHLENQGVSRFKKIKHVFTNILQEDYSLEIEKKYADKFSNIVFDKIIKADFIPGALNFLESLHKSSVKSFLLSATPKEELLKICFKKKIDTYFSKSCGSPVSKEDHGKLILSEYSLAPSEVMFFGDSLSDLNASQKLGTHFIGVTYKNQKVFTKNICTIQDFREIDVKKLGL